MFSPQQGLLPHLRAFRLFCLCHCSHHKLAKHHEFLSVDFQSSSSTKFSIRTQRNDFQKVMQGNQVEAFTENLTCLFLSPWSVKRFCCQICRHLNESVIWPNKAMIVKTCFEPKKREKNQPRISFSRCIVCHHLETLQNRKILIWVSGLLGGVFCCVKRTWGCQGLYPLLQTHLPCKHRHKASQSFVQQRRSDFVIWSVVFP